jgi:hypothetical protein
MPEPCFLCGLPAATPAGYCWDCVGRGVPAADDVDPCCPPFPPELLPRGARVACEPDCAGWDYDGLL